MQRHKGAGDIRHDRGLGQCGETGWKAWVRWQRVSSLLKHWEFYSGSNGKALPVLRHRRDESGDFGFDGLESGRAEKRVDRKETQVTLSPSLGSHLLCSRWCCVRLLESRSAEAPPSSVGVRVSV